jgi:hypothetical protein
MGEFGARPVLAPLALDMSGPTAAREGSAAPVAAFLAEQTFGPPTLKSLV